MEIENIYIKKIIPYEKNPRKNDRAADIVAKSIQEFGFRVPIIIDKNNVIIAGHTRLKAAEKLGMTEIPCIRADNLTDEQVKAFRIMDNKSIEYADWDIDLLKEELTGLKDMNFDLELTGFNQRELNELIKLYQDEEFDIDDETEKALKEGPKRVKEGEVWQLGDHKLAIGNCVNEKNWQNLFGDEKFDFMFTDPPYKLAYTERIRQLGGGKTVKNKTYSQVGKTDGQGKGRFKGMIKTAKGFGFRGQRRYLGVERAGGVPEFDEWLSIADKYKNETGSNIMIFENWKNTPELWNAIVKYWKVKNMVIWHLPNRAQGFSRKYFLFNKYDIAILGDTGDKELNEQYEDAFEKFMIERGQKLIDNYEVSLYGQLGDSAFNRKKRRATAKVTDHITWTADTESASGQNLVFGTKPVQILIPYIKVLSNPGEIVLDPYGGSGSTLIACEVMQRKCRMIEIEPIYAEVIINRWEKFTGKTAKKLK